MGSKVGRSTWFSRVGVVLLVCAFSSACTPDDGSVPAAGEDSVVRPARNSGQPPNIILITVESLRPDHVGVYGGGSRSRPDVSTTPVLDAFAAEAMVYEDAHAVTSWTLASHASLFTGLYPTAHQTRRATDRLDDSYLTLAERVASRGYDTAGVVSGPYLRRTHKLNQGFAHYHDEIASESNAKSHGDTTNPAMLSAMKNAIDRELDPTRPFLLFAYFWDPHYDYVPPEPFSSMFVSADCEPIDLQHYEEKPTVNSSISPGQLAYVFSQYAGEIRWTDQHLGEFFSFLKDRGLWDDTVIILTADHGEEFFDHGEKGHYNNVYVESVHVPLIVKYAKGGPVGRDARLVSLVDVVPTVLELSGGEAEGFLDGRNLLDSPPSTDRAVFFELLSVWGVSAASPGGEENGEGKDRSLFSGLRFLWDAVLAGGVPRTVRVQTWSGIRKGGHKLVVSPELDRFELYDVKNDPKETRNIAGQEAVLADEMKRELLAWQAKEEETASQFVQGGAAQLSDKEVDELRSLGYLQ